jgi:hypothetical protein
VRKIGIVIEKNYWRDERHLIVAVREQAVDGWTVSNSERKLAGRYVPRVIIFVEHGEGTPRDSQRKTSEAVHRLTGMALGRTKGVTKEGVAQQVERSVTEGEADRRREAEMGVGK